jgi:hypothetical protein
MRLSLMKAAYAALDGAAYRKSRKWGTLGFCFVMEFAKKSLLLGLDVGEMLYLQCYRRGSCLSVVRAAAVR